MTREKLVRIGEWADYIGKYYQELKEKFPGIDANYHTALIISRDTEALFAGHKNRKEYIGVLKRQFNVEEIWTYDDLLERAQFRHQQLSALAGGYY